MVIDPDEAASGVLKKQKGLRSGVLRLAMAAVVLHDTEAFRWYDGLIEQSVTVVLGARGSWWYGSRTQNFRRKDSERLEKQKVEWHAVNCD
jgi:hypothetical protein